MSTKNLARTVIEGGRRGHSKYLRRRGLRLHRVHEHAVCKALTKSPDDADEALWPRRHRTWEDIEHADRTNPCERFLASRAGRRWDAVRSEIMRRFDTRKLAGRHVTYEHLLNRVVCDRNVHRLIYWWRTNPPKFWVDEQGILRHNPNARW